MFQSSKIKKRDNNETNYINRKNRINKDYLLTILFNNLNLEFFSEKNIFIIATDDNTSPLKNYGATSMGYYIEGLGENHRARKLIEDIKDGFIVGNNINCDNKRLYNFYFNRTKDIKLIFDRNNREIDIIKKGINKEITEEVIKKISKDIDYINERYLYEGSIDNEIKNAETERETVNVSINENKDILNVRNSNILTTIGVKMGKNREIEARLILKSLKEQNLYTENYAETLKENLIEKESTENDINTNNFNNNENVLVENEEQLETV